MYEKTKLSVHLPEFFPSNLGLKQGCNMSPILFNLFINDINEIFDERFCHPVTLCNIKLSNLLYADDLILIPETRTGLQSCLNNLQAYCQKWKLTVSHKNTKVMVVEKGNPQRKCTVSVSKRSLLKFVSYIHSWVLL